ncbi:uncharacterized protein NPIL_169441 [Nephila pilipes]|uniref:RRM domain-containing protein n=1 Tax=Nephila pilipes TaxID=299642 RepID=A0A8X6PLA6_NEPPI|nr:uncharacterized protein NPIL_169441 [Nephila pilipes]
MLYKGVVLNLHNLPIHVDEYRLKNLFSFNGIGPIKKVVKLRDEAFVLFSNMKDAEKVLLIFNGTNLDGHVIDITWANPKLLSSSIISKRSMFNIDNHLSFQREKPTNISNYVPAARSMPLSPIKVLEHICFRNGYDAPDYYINHIIDGSCNNNVTYTSKVFIRKLPFWEKSFSSDRSFSTSQEAQFYAAVKALNEIVSCLNNSNISLNYSPESIIRVPQQSSSQNFVTVPGGGNSLNFAIGYDGKTYSFNNGTQFDLKIFQNLSKNSNGGEYSNIPLNYSQNSIIRLPLSQNFVPVPGGGNPLNFAIGCERRSFPSNNGDPYNPYGLLATAAYLANLELQDNSYKQK